MAAEDQRQASAAKAAEEQKQALREEQERLRELKGLDKEVALKQQRKLTADPAYVLAAQHWIEDMTDEKIVGDFFTQLQNGVLLCRVLCRIQPGLIRRFSPKPKNIWESKANIELYLEGCKKLGLPGADLFLVPDLLKKKSFNEVLQNIYALGGIAQRYQGYTSRSQSKFGTIKSDLIEIQARRRAETAVAVAKAREEEEARRRALAEKYAGQELPVLRPITPVMRAGKEVHGFDRDLELKFRKEFTTDELMVCAIWISTLTNRPVRSSSIVEFGQDLKTGETLCHLLNAIRPGTVPKIHKLPNPLYHRENLEFYRKGCLSFGMHPADTFHTNDLYEEKYLPGVVKNIFALGVLVERSVSGFKGPHLVLIRKDGKIRRQSQFLGPVGLCLTPQDKENQGKESKQESRKTPEAIEMKEMVQEPADHETLFTGLLEGHTGDEEAGGDGEAVVMQRRCCCTIL